MDDTAAGVPALGVGTPEPPPRAKRPTRRSSHRGHNRGLRALGIAFLLAGLGVAGYIAWTIWGTTLVAERQIEAEIEGFYEDNGLAPADPAALHTDFEAFPVPVADTSGGGTWGVLHVPTWRGASSVYGETLDGVVPIAEGTSRRVLDKGWAGHWTETAGVGQQGNFALAGHRRSYGQNFLHVPDLRPGDAVAVETKDVWYVFRVVDGSPYMVGKKDVAPLAPVPGDETWTQPQDRRLATLYTCTGSGWYAYANDRRAIVHAELVGWVERAAGTPEALR